MLSFGIVFAVIGVIFAQDCKEPPAFVQNGEPCCKIPGKMENQGLQDNLNECRLNTKEFGRPTCEMMDCVYNKLKLLKDGKLNQDALGAALDDNSIEFPDFKDVFMKIKQNCVKDLSTVATHIPCDSIKLFICGQRFLISDCPNKFWNTSDECSKVKEFVEKCPSIF